MPLPQASASVGRTVRSIWALFLGIALLTLGNGLQGSVLGVRATFEGFGTAVTGAIMAAYYVGYVVGSLWTPRLLEGVGHIRVFSALASAASSAVLLHAQFPYPATWFLVRLVSGFCLVGLFIVAESWLNDVADNDNRGQLLSAYMTTIMAGLGGGQLLLNLADPSGFGLFVLVSVLLSVALVPLALSTRPGPTLPPLQGVPLRELTRRVPLGVAGCVASGLVFGAIFGMGVVYGQQIGLSVARTSVFMAVVVFGAMLLQVPIGRLSDRIDRRIVIAGTSLAAAALAILGAGISGADSTLVFVIAGVYGGLALPLYALSIAHANDYLDAETRVGATASLVLFNAFGLVVGPLATSITMELVGPAGFFWTLAVVHAGLTLYATHRRTVRPAVKQVARAMQTLLPARATAQASALLTATRSRGGPPRPPGAG